MEDRVYIDRLLGILLESAKNVKIPDRLKPQKMEEYIKKIAENMII